MLLAVANQLDRSWQVSWRLLWDCTAAATQTCITHTTSHVCAFITEPISDHDCPTPGVAHDLYAAGVHVCIVADHHAGALAVTECVFCQRLLSTSFSLQRPTPTFALHLAMAMLLSGPAQCQGSCCTGSSGGYKGGAPQSSLLLQQVSQNHHANDCQAMFAAHIYFTPQSCTCISAGHGATGQQTMPVTHIGWASSPCRGFVCRSGKWWWQDKAG